MKTISRPYTHEDDFLPIMNFLNDIYQKFRSYHSWFPDRFEGIHPFEKESDIRIWEGVDGRGSPPKSNIIAVANPESTYNYFLQVDPDYSFLEREILTWVENHCRELKQEQFVNKSDKKIRLMITILERNENREKLLTSLGYQKRDKIYGWHRVRSKEKQIPKFECPTGFEIRSVTGWSDYEELARLVRQIFGHGKWFTAEVIEATTKRTFYRPDLDLVITNPDLKIVSFCTFRFDPISKVTQLEPLATHPDYRGLGLAKAIIYEGLTRSMTYDPELFYIGGAADTPGANKLYDSVGFDEKYAMYNYFKEL